MPKPVAVTFPAWIDQQRTPSERAKWRLKYMLFIAALRRYGRASIHDIAREIKCDHSSIFNAIKRGQMSVEMSAKLEQVFGRDELRAEHLRNPLIFD